MDMAMYKGKKKTAPYFEGWYFKMVSGNGETVAVIPGLFIEKDKSYSFVQIMDSQGTVIYEQYPISAFEYSNRRLLINIGANSFSGEGLKLDINGDHNISGKIFFSENIKYPAKIFSPGIMGPFSYIPFLECSHDVISVKNRLSGSLLINGVKINMDGGEGYIEKDRGNAFPQKYLWVQCGKFRNHDASFMLAAAAVPIMKYDMRGLIAFLYSEGDFYRFATYNGAKVESMTYCGDTLNIEVKSRGFTLKTEITRNILAKLKAPSEHGMDENVFESCSDMVKVELRTKERVLFSDFSTFGSSEISGEIAADY